MIIATVDLIVPCPVGTGEKRVGFGIEKNRFEDHFHHLLIT